MEKNWKKKYKSEINDEIDGKGRHKKKGKKDVQIQKYMVWMV